MSANRLLIRMAKQSPMWMLLSISLGFSGAIFNGVGITLIIPLALDFLGQDILGNSNFPPILKTIFSAFDGIPGQYRVLAMMACLVTTIFLKNLAGYGSSIASGILSRSYVSSLRKEGFSLLLDVDLDYYSKVRLGDLMNYLNTEVNRAASAVRTLASIATLSITIFVFLGILIAISWQLTLVATILMAAVALANQVSINKARSFGQELSSAAASLSGRSIEVLSGIRLVKATANEEREYSTIERLIRKREEAEFRSQLVFASIGPVNEMLSILALIALIVIGRFLFLNQLQAFSSVILTYLVVLFRLLPLIGQLNNGRSQLANTSVSAEILSAFLSREDKPFMKSGSVNFSHLSKGIRFNHIFFRYPNADAWALEDIDLYLPKGQTLALVGSSGAGKSTLADLLPRFYDPVEGCIEIDGVDLRDFNLREFRQRIGVVSQDTFLFNASVRDNIRYGCPEATDEEIFEAARRANAHEFIEKLPNGFETMIGDRGILLSGGQRQRLAIARALVQNPEILILDEATSALDTVSERLVQQAIDDLSKDRTTLVIAHRLSTVHKANQIAVLEKGRVVELGNHQDLLDKGGHYANLYSMQFSDQSSDGAEELIPNSIQAAALSKTSYEIRSQLSGMLGILNLLTDDMLDNPAEHEELTFKAYQSALNILQVLEHLEKNIPTAEPAKEPMTRI